MVTVKPDPTVQFQVGSQLFRLAMEASERAVIAPDRLATLLTADVGQTESEIVYRENKLELHRYEPETKRHDTPIFIVYALVNRPYILDLQPDRSVIRRLLEAGYEVYLIDWGEPSRLDSSLGLDDYVCRYLDNTVSVACERSAVDSVHLLGYCMGGSLATMYTALFQSRVQTLSVMATPVIFNETGGLLERWATYYDPSTVIETYGNAPAELLAVQFAMMEPVANLVTKYVGFYDNLDDEEFVENFARMELWTWDGVDVAGRAFREFVEEVYKQNKLVNGEMVLDGRRVDPETIDVPLLQIVGEYDHIVPPESSKPLNDVVGSEDEQIIEFPRGHIGISVSTKAHEELWPAVTSWYAERGP